MSSIERAMDKVVSATAPATSSETPVAAAPPAAEPLVASAVESAVESAATVSAPSPVAAPAAAPAAVGKVAETEVARSAEAVANSKNFVHIDFARLAAAGFLTPDQPTTRQSEEYQHIKRRVLGNMAPGVLNTHRPSNLILITSSVPSEGKTFTSVNLAISLAMEVDHTILLVDTDIMKRDLSRALGVVERKGLFDLLASPGLRLEDLLVRTNMRNLVILPVGTKREGSTELLASMRMRELADEIAVRYKDRVVLFDSPPVLATTTASALAPLVGQVILVAEAGSTKHETIREALQRLDRVSITGVILNKGKQAAASSYDYYGSYYGQSR